MAINVKVNENKEKTIQLPSLVVTMDGEMVVFMNEKGNGQVLRGGGDYFVGDLSKWPLDSNNQPFKFKPFHGTIELSNK